MKAPERLQWHRFRVFIVNFDNISQIVLVLLFLTLSIYLFTWNGLISNGFNSNSNG